MKKLSKIIIGTILLISLILESSYRWVIKVFGVVPFDQFIFNLKAPKVGVDKGIVKDGVIHCLIIPIIIVIVMMFIYKYFFTQYNFKLIFRKSNKEVCINKYKKTISTIIIICLMVAIKGTITSVYIEYGIKDYVENISNKSTIYENYYINPEDIEFKHPEKMKNLIYISLESVESTFADIDNGGVKDKNIIPNLTKLYQENNNFNSTTNKLIGGYTLAGSTWTAGALTTQFLGVPLTLPIHGNDYVTDTFLPGAYGIGDILEEAGYNQSVVLGSDSDFAGRTMLYKEHGNAKVLDYKKALEDKKIPEDYHVFWGFEDEKLFTFCKEEILSLAEKDEPFFLATLTVDTHAEDGYVCEDCPDIHTDQYSNVLTCSDKKIYEFVNWIKEQEFYEDTVIVIAGDHKTMDSDYISKEEEANYDRTVYHTIINSEIEAIRTERKYATLDFLPTTLASMGITWDNDRLALGTNLYSDTDTLLEYMGFDKLDKELRRYSDYYYNNILYAK